MYIRKYKSLIKKGYSDHKAFALVETELNEILENQKEDMRILRGGALSIHGDSYLERA